jgi:hypothetical protein
VAVLAEVQSPSTVQSVWTLEEVQALQLFSEHWVLWFGSSLSKNDLIFLHLLTTD